ncbi:MAG: hypothetical protein GQ531_06630 [Sulfurovum sp.]|nr:hypothetical protein [Sulfurovum sp.]
MIKHSKFSTLLREPLFHFLLIGAVFFFVFSQMNTGEDENSPQIIITKAKIETLANNFAKAKGRLPSPQEMKIQLEYDIREQVLYREAMAMGLDKDDMIIRRRLTQKMKYLFNDLGVVGKASEEELKKFVADHPSKFMVPATISFAQVYFEPSEHETTLVEDANALLEKLRISTVKESIGLGDRSLLPYDFRNERKTDIDSMFGKEFTKQAFSSPTNSWEGPFESAYGVHLIYIHERTEDHLPPLADIRERAQREWMSLKQHEVNEIFYQSLHQRYEIIVDDEVLSDANVSAK